MPRVTLAHWHGSHAPGDVLDVTDAELNDLTRDGRVASVQPEPPQAPPAEAPETARKKR